jgi:hypothetical protein
MESGQNASVSPETNQADLLQAADSLRANNSRRKRKVVDFSSDGTPPASYQAIATDFEVLPGGSFLELLKVRGTSAKFQLLYGSGPSYIITNRLNVSGKIFIPPRCSPTLFRAVRMPSGVRPSGDARHMFNRLAEILHTFVELPDELLVRVAAYVLATWFPESLAVAPLLWITGPPTSGKTMLLRLLHCLCRRAILVTDVTPAASASWHLC